MHTRVNSCGQSPQRNFIRSPSKEQFFTVKHRHRKQKSSHLLVQPEHSDFQRRPKHRPTLSNLTDTDILRQIKSEEKRWKQKQLVSTFGSDNFLNFRSKPPKRKCKKIEGFCIPSIKVVEECQSENEKSKSFVKNRSVKTKRASKNFFSPCFIRKEWKISDFIVLGKLGEGTYSEVFRVVEKTTGFLCSLKVLSKQKIRMLKVEQNLLKQIKIHLFIDHPNIISLYGCFSDAQNVYLLTELASDHSLYEAMQNCKSHGFIGMPLQPAKNYIFQLCKALSYLHKHMILHRDIKPENMLITFTTTMKLCDFGWSTHNPESAFRSTLCGTPLYLAPQLIQQGSYNEAVDVWATGIVTYELLTGEIPFRIRSVRDLNKVVHQDINYDKIDDIQAVDFIKGALVKEQSGRKSIQQICRHPYIYEPSTAGFP